jgi:hypothetical protein
MGMRRRCPSLYKERMTSSDSRGEYKFLGMVVGCVGYFAILISSVITAAPMSMGSQKSEKTEQDSATIESQAKPLR